MRRLPLQPVEPALAGLVGGGERLGHQALVPGRDRAVEEALGLLRVAGHEPRQEPLRRDEAREPRGALGVGDVDERPVAFEVQQVEEERREGQLPARLLDVLAAPQPPHRLLERPRPPVRAQGERLALDHGLPDGQRARPLDDLGQAGRDVLELPREDPDLVAGTVDLEPRAVDLVLEGSLAETGERFLRVPGRAREHRRDRREQPQREAGEAGRALLEGGAGERAEVGRVHGRAPDVGRREPRRPRDRVGHDAVERALADLAEEQLDEEPAAGLVGGLEQRPETAQPPLGRAGSRQGGDLGETLVETRERERRPDRIARGHRRLQGAPADADPSLGQRAGQVEGRELRLPPAGLGQEGRDELDLLALPGRGPDAGHEVDEPAPLHGTSIPPVAAAIATRRVPRAPRRRGQRPAHGPTSPRRGGLSASTRRFPWPVALGRRQWPVPSQRGGRARGPVPGDNDRQTDRRVPGEGPLRARPAASRGHRPSPVAGGPRP